MNVIEARNTSKRCTRRGHPSWSLAADCSIVVFYRLVKRLIDAGELLANDWEIEEPKKQTCVIPNVRWYKTDQGYIHPAIRGGFITALEGLIGKPLMKMTLEWEE